MVYWSVTNGYCRDPRVRRGFHRQGEGVTEGSGFHEGIVPFK